MGLDIRRPCWSSARCHRQIFTRGKRIVFHCFPSIQPVCRPAHGWSSAAAPGKGGRRQTCLTLGRCTTASKDHLWRVLQRVASPSCQCVLVRISLPPHNPPPHHLAAPPAAHPPCHGQPPPPPLFWVLESMNDCVDLGSLGGDAERPFRPCLSSRSPRVVPRARSGRYRLELNTRLRFRQSRLGPFFRDSRANTLWRQPSCYSIYEYPDPDRNHSFYRSGVPSW